MRSQHRDLRFASRYDPSFLCRNICCWCWRRAGIHTRRHLMSDTLKRNFELFWICSARNSHPGSSGRNSLVQPALCRTPRIARPGTGEHQEGRRTLTTYRGAVAKSAHLFRPVASLLGRPPWAGPRRYRDGWSPPRLIERFRELYRTTDHRWAGLKSTRMSAIDARLKLSP